MAESAPLAVLPLTSILRSFMTMAISSSPLLLPPSLAAMSILANATSPALNPDKNPLLRFFLKNTFYAQFCAGEYAPEVRRTIESLKSIGFGGVILGYAKEVVLTEEQMKDLASCNDGAAAEECLRTEITPWTNGTMETVLLASPGDFVALKFTGAGRQALHALSQSLPPSQALSSAIDSICQLAASRGVRLLFDAEQQALQPGIDQWSLDFMRKYNTAESAVVYGTYQAYLKSTPATLGRHLAAARDGGFALGVKLVRGAYLGSDPRHLIHDTKADTDAAYDGIVQALVEKQWAGPLIRPPTPASVQGRNQNEQTAAEFPELALVVATHNRESVLKARELLSRTNTTSDVTFAQLQGMADEVSCELVSSNTPATIAGPSVTMEKSRAYKYLVWGSTGECMKYLLRRAHENRDAVQRTRSGRDAMRTELLRRTKSVLRAST